jgi:hypothetical protein
MNTTNFIAIVLSPLFAVLISMWLQDRKEKRRQKQVIFGSLMSTRHQIVSDEIVRSLNMIDVVFYNKKTVRDLWHEYFSMLNNEGLNNPTGWKQRDAKRLDLIHEIAAEVGLGKNITHLDVDRVYMPVGISEANTVAREIGTELLRVLKATQSLQIVPREPGGHVIQ